MVWWQALLLLGVILGASGLIYLLFRRPSVPEQPQTRQMVAIAPPEYYGLSERYRMHYSTWSIPTQECLPTYTPAHRDPSVLSLHPNVARDILAVLDETLKQKEEN